MAASGYVLLTLGVPCVVLGLYLRRQRPPGKKGQKKSKSQQIKKGKETRKEEASGGSLIWGGLVLTLLGMGFLLAHYMKWFR